MWHCQPTASPGGHPCVLQLSCWWRMRPDLAPVELGLTLCAEEHSLLQRGPLRLPGQWGWRESGEKLFLSWCGRLFLPRVSFLTNTEVHRPSVSPCQEATGGRRTILCWNSSHGALNPIAQIPFYGLGQCVSCRIGLMIRTFKLVPNSNDTIEPSLLPHLPGPR